MWKVRFLNDDGELVEGEAASLAKVTSVAPEDRIVVIQRAHPIPQPPADGAEDKAQGSDAVKVKKG